jgi:hypothetical protein
MRGKLFVLVILVVTPALAFSQSRKHESSITGCLTSTTVNNKKQYRLVDQKKVTNIVYSKTIDLESHVGQSVTLVGDISPTPSSDEGTAQPMPIFWVLEEVKPASGTCK